MIQGFHAFGIEGVWGLHSLDGFVFSGYKDSPFHDHDSTVDRLFSLESMHLLHFVILFVHLTQSAVGCVWMQSPGWTLWSDAAWGFR